MSDSLDAYLILSGLLFAIGSFGFLARRNAISMLMSIELMLNAVNLAIVAFGAFIPALAPRASVIALMVMAVAAGRGDRRPRDRHRHLPQQEDAARRRVRRDAPVSELGAPPDGRCRDRCALRSRSPADGGLRVHGAGPDRRPRCRRVRQALSPIAAADGPALVAWVLVVFAVGDRDGRVVAGADRRGAALRGARPHGFDALRRGSRPASSTSRSASSSTR